MNKTVDAIIDAGQEEIIASLQKLIRIPSVREDAAGENAPFGQGIRDSLTSALALGKELGFRTKDLDGYAGTLEYGPEGAELLGVMCHLDVVPEGTGWDHPAFGGELADGRIYGRGTLDDKGPAIAAMYALSAVKEAGVELKRRVRIILGCDEESDWECMHYYTAHEEIPAMAFTPDGNYPVVNSEKGIYHVDLKREFPSSITVEAGERVNVVPGEATAYVPLALADVMPAAEAYSLKSGFPVAAVKEGEGTRITVTGVAAHASSPELGKNALMALLHLLALLPLEGEDAALVEGLCGLLKMDHHGETLGIDVTDASGRQSVNPGIMRWSEKGMEQLSLDLRCPSTRELDTIEEELREKFASIGVSIDKSSKKKAHFVPADSELVSKLLAVYNARTGENAKPLAIGGGTYARAFENAVAFGCEIEGHESPMHMPNEFISVEDLMFDVHMIADAILALAAK